MSGFRAVYFFTTLSLMFTAGGLYAIPSSDSFHDAVGTRDFEAVQEFVNSKRTIPLCEKMPCLKISGDVKFEVQYRRESLDGVKLRGHGVVDRKGIPIPHSTGEMEFNIFIDYKSDRVWSKTQLNFDDAFGLEDPFHHTIKSDRRGIFGSGIFDDINLKIAYFGWNFWEYKCGEVVHKLNVEIGRRRLYKIFDSRIEFNNYADGILLEYNEIFKKDWKLFAQVLGFVVDERVNHFAWGAEIGVLDFMELKIDAMYSYIDWDTIGRNRAAARGPLGSKFKISQWCGAYNFDPKITWDQDARLYGAFLINTAAPELRRVHSPQNLGWYAGFIIGKVKDPGDWSFDVNWQVVQAQAMPDSEVHGIGRGNSLKETFSANGRGKTNYKGWHFEWLYKLTKCMLIDPSFEFSTPWDKRLGGPAHFSKFELDMVLEF